jgi:hypothetical protein
MSTFDDGNLEKPSGQQAATVNEWGTAPVVRTQLGIISD